MSLGLRSGSAPLMMTPSTMYKGSWLRPCALSEVGPRSSTAGCAPGRPLADTMFAGSLPCSSVNGSAAGTCSFEASIVVTLNGTLIRSVASCTPVTTTASSWLTSVTSEKSWVCSPALNTIGRLVGLWPIVRTRMVTVCPETRAAGTRIVYCPLVPVRTATFSSTSCTFASDSASPRSSVTLPCTTASCAHACPAAASREASMATPSQGPRCDWVIRESLI